MKNKVLKVLCLMLAISCVASFAKPKEEKRVVVLSPKLQNLEAAEEYCAPLVKSKMDANFREYTKYTIVDITDEAAVNEAVASSSTDAFSSEVCTKLQALTTANAAVTMNIIKTPKGFILTCNYIDLTTGGKVAASSPITKESEDALYDGASCAVDEATIQLCEKLKIKLTGSQIVKLKGSDQVAASDNEEVADIIPQSEEDCVKAGYKMFTFGKEAEDNIIFKNKTDIQYEIDICAVHRKKGFKRFGAITIKKKKGYKGNPLDKDLDQYPAVYMKVMNIKANIINRGDHHGDQLFDIEPM